MRRIRLCQLITELRPAGAERCVYELARRLDRRRFDVQVAALRGGAVQGWLEQAGVRTHVLGVRGKWDVPKLGVLVRLLRRERIELLHTHLFHADLTGRAAAAIAGVGRLVHTVHVAEARWRPWQFAFARLFSGACDRIVCVSRAVREHHARLSGLPAWRYQVIPNGIDAQAYCRDAALRQTLRRQWGVGPEDVLVAFVGRLDRQKGIDTLLAAMERVLACSPSVRLAMAGDGPLRGVVGQFASRGAFRDRTTALGLVQDVRGVLSAADVLAAPSRWEGLPLAAVEAMAAGLPIAASRVAGLSEVVLDGLTGLLVRPDDPGALAEAILRLAGDADLRARLGSAGRRRAAQDYSIAANVAAHEALYLELVEGRPCRPEARQCPG